MKKLALSFVLLWSLASNAFTTEVSIGDVKYRISTNSRTAEAIGPTVDIIGSLVIPSSVTYDGVSYRVTSIGGFADKEKITSVVLGEGIISIKDSTFLGCKNLGRVDWPKSLVSIGNSAFRNCQRLRTVVLENVEVGDYCFAGCTLMEDIKIINASCSGDDYSSCFSGCQFEHAFIDCKEVKSWFHNRLKLKQVALGPHVEIIGERAFDNCKSLETISIPNTVKQICDKAFQECNRLEWIDLPLGLERIGNDVFNFCTRLKEVSIPSSVNYLGERIFINCQHLESVQLPKWMSHIGLEAFQGTRLKNIAFPEGLKKIEDYIVAGCGLMEYVTIPSTVTQIGGSAFSGALSLTDIYCYAEVVPTFFSTETIFGVETPLSGSNIKNVTLHVPAELLDDYMAAEYWKNVKSIVPLKERCATPAISYSDGKLTFSSDTEGTSFTATIIDYDARRHFETVIPLTTTYYIRVCADSPDHELSESATAMLSWKLNAPKLERLEKKTYAELPAQAILNQSKPNEAFKGKAEINGLWYDIDTENRQATVVKSDFSSRYSGNIIIPSAIEYQGVRCTVSAIGDYAFQYCDNIVSVVVPSSVVSIGTNAFEECQKLSSVVLPNSLSSLGSYAFMNCSNLASISIPMGLNSILERTFSGCRNLQSLTIPEGVSNIYSYAFERCTSLLTLDLPSTMSFIGHGAFSNCTELAEIYSRAEIVPTTVTDCNPFMDNGDSFFEKATLFVPSASVILYRIISPWSQFHEIRALSGDLPDIKCATPSIDYENGQLILRCETEGATIITDISNDDANTFHAASIPLASTYRVNTYASKNGYDNSDVAVATLCWIDDDVELTSGVYEVTSIPRAMLIRCDGSTIQVTGLAEGTHVAVANMAGQIVGSSVVSNGGATVRTSLLAGECYIISAGGKAIKMIMK